jgi:3-(3-hydroxy-phenyl)propionate hydroxylase
MLAARAAKAGAKEPLPGLPGFTTGFTHKSPRAGELLPQTTAARASNGKRGKLDDILGDGFWLLTQQAAATPANVKPFVLGHDVIDETGRLDQWLAGTGASAALIRPDRYVFGTGSPENLCRALTGMLHAA